MISILLIFYLSIFGFLILSLAKNKLSSLEKIIIASVIGPVIFSILCFIFFCFLGIKTALVFTFLLSLLFNILVIKQKKFSALLKKIKLNKKLIFISMVFLSMFVWSHSRVILSPSVLGLFAGRSNYGDTPYHTALITSFAWGENYPPENPIYANLPMIYYLTSDFFSSIILSLNSNLRESLLVPTIFFSLTIVVITYLLTKELKGKTAALLAPFLLLLNGGLGFFYWLKDIKGQPFLYALTHITREYNHMAENNNNITNFIAGLLVPERPLLFGIPIFLIILLLLLKQKNQTKVNFLHILAAVLSGLMPIIHLYGFVVLSILLAFFAFFDYLSNKKKFKKWFVFFVIFISLSLTQLYFVFLRLAHSTFKTYFHFGWLKKPEENFFIFWFKNLGFIFPLSLFTLFIPKIKKRLKLYFLPFILVFIFGNLFIFQPYPWDNIKIFLFVLPALAVIVSFLLEQLITSKYWLNKLLFFILFFLTISGGLIGFLGEPQGRPILFNQKDLETGEFIKINTNPNDIFLTAPQHNSPASSLAGRQILMGYPGNIWVHGIDYQEREQDVYKMFNPVSLDEFMNFATKYDINYVLFGPGELFINTPNKDFFDSNFTKIFDNDVYKIYQVNLNSG